MRMRWCSVKSCTWTWTGNLMLISRREGFGYVGKISSAFHPFLSERPDRYLCVCTICTVCVNLLCNGQNRSLGTSSLVLWCSGVRLGLVRVRLGCHDMERRYCALPCLTLLAFLAIEERVITGTDCILTEEPGMLFVRRNECGGEIRIYFYHLSCETLRRNFGEHFYSPLMG